MKRLLYPMLLLPLIFTGCYPGSRLSYDPAMIDTSMPGRITNGQLDIFFPGEVGPGKPYRKLAFLESEHSNATMRLNELRTEARAYGADALIILSSTNELRLQASLVTEAEDSDEEMESTGIISNSPIMQGLAIVYEDNLSPDSFNQYANVYRYAEDEKGEAELVLRKEYDYYQNVIDTRIVSGHPLPEVVTLYPERTSLHYLINNREDWIESHFDRNYRKQNNEEGEWLRQVRVIRTDNGFLKKIILKEKDTYADQGYEYFEIRTTYDRTGRITRSEFYKRRGHGNKLTEIHHYTYEGKRLAEEQILKVINEKPQPWLLIEYVPFPENYTIEQATKY